jgi:signal peptidase I
MANTNSRPVLPVPTTPVVPARIPTNTRDVQVTQDAPISPRPAEKHMSRRSHFITALMLIAGVAILIGGIAFRMGGFHVETVLSGSMRPTASPGDLAITQGVPLAALQVGDVIVFTPPDETQSVMHRITSMDDGAITTKGDANSADDPWTIRLAGPTAYRLVAVVPLVGWLTQLERPALLLAGLLALLGIVRWLWKEVIAKRLNTRLQHQT